MLFGKHERDRRSSATFKDQSVQDELFSDCLTFEGRTDKLSYNVGNQVQTHVV
jgi:hypothetical protein